MPVRCHRLYQSRATTASVLGEQLEQMVSVVTVVTLVAVVAVVSEKVSTNALFGYIETPIAIGYTNAILRAGRASCPL